LLDDSQGTLAKSYDHLPSFLQKLITQLPTKLTGSLAPELLAVATEAAAAGGLGGAAKSFLKISTLKDLVTKPGAVVGLLKTIMNALKLRWPAFMGTNVLLSLGLFGKQNLVFERGLTNHVQCCSSYSGTAINEEKKSV
jgi:hypothetical protein